LGGAIGDLIKGWAAGWVKVLKPLLLNCLLEELLVGTNVANLRWRAALRWWAAAILLGRRTAGSRAAGIWRLALYLSWRTLEK